ncbi:MAG: tetratricopeptide repeat protein [Isosphaeraceae bacterium]
MPGVSFQLVAFSPDRERVLVAGVTNALARLVDTETGQPIGPPMTHRWPRVNALAFSPDGRHLATASRDVRIDEGGTNSTSATCQIWAAAMARPSSPLLPHINYVAALAFSPDGKVLASGDYTAMVHLWDAETGASLGQPLRAGSIVMSLAFSPDGQTLAAGTAERNNQLVLWDLASGHILGEPIRFKGIVNRLAFSPDGHRLAAASSDTTVRLVDVATGRAVGERLDHDEFVLGLEFSPDSRLLLTVSSGLSGTAARLWDSTSGQPASPALAHPSASAGALAFSPDGTIFATGCEDGAVSLWDVASRKPIGPPLMLRGSVLGLVFRPDGRTLLGVDDGGNVRSWTMPVPSDEPVERLIRHLQVRVGVKLDTARELVILDPETWRRSRAEVDESPESSPSHDDLAWHEAAARDSEAIGDSFGARWHMERMISDRPGDGLVAARLAITDLLAGDFKATENQIARAIALGPRDRILDWLLQRVEDFRASGRPGDALRLLDPVIAARPSEWSVHVRRAEVLAALGHTAEREAELRRAIACGADIPFLVRLAEERSRAGRWEAAIELYDRAIAQGTISYEVWIQAAVAHLAIDDAAGYRRVCDVLRSRHPGSGGQRWAGLEPARFSVIVETCSLAPGGIGDDGRSNSWADDLRNAASDGRKELKHAYLGLLGGLLYRSGRFCEAIDRINEGIAADDGEISPDDTAWLAMAYHESGDHAKARSMLARMTAEEPATSVSRFWAVEEIRLLQREAERLILDRPFPADPFAH